MVLFKTNTFTTCSLTVGRGFEQPNEKTRQVIASRIQEKKTKKSESLLCSANVYIFLLLFLMVLIALFLLSLLHHFVVQPYFIYLVLMLFLLFFFFFCLVFLLSLFGFMIKTIISTKTKNYWFKLSFVFRSFKYLNIYLFLLKTLLFTSNHDNKYQFFKINKKNKTKQKYKLLILYFVLQIKKQNKN